MKHPRVRRRLSGVLAAVALATIATFLTAAPNTAHADAHQGLQLDGFFDLAVDEAHGHVFITQGRGKDAVVVTDLAGKRLRTITGMGGARGIVLSEDRSRVFVGLADDHAIAEIDTATLGVTEHPLPTWTAGGQTMPACPQDLVLVGDLVLFGDFCPNRYSALRIFDPTTGDVSLTQPGNGSGRLVMSPAHGILLALIGSSDIVSFDVETDPALAITQRDSTFDFAQSRDLAAIPGTDRFVVDSGEVLDIRNLSVVGAYGGNPVDAPTQPEPETVVARKDGVVAFGLHRYSPAGDVRVYATMNRLMRDHAFIDTDDPIFQDERLSFRPRSLEFGEHRLYGIEFADRGTEARFWAIRPREDTVLDVTTRKPRYARGELVTVDVRASGPLQSRRGIAWIERWDRNDQVSGRVRYTLDRRRHGVFQFRLRAKSTVHVTLNDGGDLVVKSRIIGFRR